jgi:hypothetical protein
MRQKAEVLEENQFTFSLNISEIYQRDGGGRSNLFTINDR